MNKPDWSNFDFSPLIEQACNNGAIDEEGIKAKCLAAGFTDEEAQSVVTQLHEMWQAHSMLKDAEPTGLTH